MQIYIGIDKLENMSPRKSKCGLINVLTRPTRENISCGNVLFYLDDDLCINNNNNTLHSKKKKNNKSCK